MQTLHDPEVNAYKANSIEKREEETQKVSTVKTIDSYSNFFKTKSTDKLIKKQDDNLETSSPLLNPDNLNNLPVIQKMSSTMKRLIPSNENIILVANQHLTCPTEAFYCHILEVYPKITLIITGKFYSTNDGVRYRLEQLGRQTGRIKVFPDARPKVPGEYSQLAITHAKRFWEFVYLNIQNQEKRGEPVKKIITWDDNGHLLFTLPNEILYGKKYELAGIAHTRGGLYPKAITAMPFPIILLASSALKIFIEPIFIAEAAINRIEIVLKSIASQNVNKQKPVIGLIGNGTIGNEILRFLILNQYKVVVYDNNPEAFVEFKDKVNDGFFRVGNCLEVLYTCDVVLGCTGTDVSKGFDINSLTRDLELFSVSSLTVEYETLLNEVAQKGIRTKTPMDNVCFTNSAGFKLTIHQGSTPINFYNSEFSVITKKIEPTFAGAYAAFGQACLNAKKPLPDGKTLIHAEQMMLNPYSQRAIVKLCLSCYPELAQYYKKNTLALFKDIYSIIHHSGGKYKPEATLDEVFYNLYLQNEEVVQSDEVLPKTPRAML